LVYLMRCPPTYERVSTALSARVCAYDPAIVRLDAWSGRSGIVDKTPFWFLVVTAAAIPVGNAIFAGILGLFAARIGKNATHYAAELQAAEGRKATEYAAELQARESRTATQYAAQLQAAQRRQDVEIAQLQTGLAALLEAATAIQSYVFYVEKEVRLRTTMSDDDWIASRPFVEPAVIGAQRLRALAQTLPSDSLRDAFIEVERLVMAVVKGSDDEDAPDVWSEATENQPDPIVTAVEATAKAIRQRLQTYPG
jgi:hypothetical protein